MLKCWSDYSGYDDFVREQWASFNITGWGGFVLKQKLKLMKSRLKKWHYRHSQNLEGKIMEFKNRISVLDAKGEAETLLEEEFEELHNLSVQLHSTARIQTSIRWQNSRFNWLKEGDANTNFFHGVMSTRRRQNAIHMVSINGMNVEGVQNVRDAVFNHFSSHFKVVPLARPSVEGLHFRQLSYGEASTLTKPFSLDEVKQAIWDCDGFKSPGPDDISLDFIKRFWEIVKDDFM
jgi:hypothetical protein